MEIEGVYEGVGSFSSECEHLRIREFATLHFVELGLSCLSGQP